MARTSDVDSATSQFFINVADNAFLDHKSPTRRIRLLRVREGRRRHGRGGPDQRCCHDSRGPYENVPAEAIEISRSVRVNRNGFLTQRRRGRRGKQRMTENEFSKVIILGFDLGGTKMMATVFDAGFKILGFHRAKTRAAKAPGSSGPDHRYNQGIARRRAHQSPASRRHCVAVRARWTSTAASSSKPRTLA